MKGRLDRPSLDEHGEQASHPQGYMYYKQLIDCSYHE